VREQNSGGWNRPKSKLVCGKPVFPVKNLFLVLKNRFFRKNFGENAQKHQKRSTLYGKFRKIPGFREILHPHHSPKLFSDRLRWWWEPPKPPTPMYDGTYLKTVLEICMDLSNRPLVDFILCSCTETYYAFPPNLDGISRCHFLQ